MLLGLMLSTFNLTNWETSGTESNQFVFLILLICGIQPRHKSVLLTDILINMQCNELFKFKTTRTFVFSKYVSLGFQFIVNISHVLLTFNFSCDTLNY